MLAAGQNIQNIILSVRNHTKSVENTVTNQIQPRLIELANIVDVPTSNQTVVSQLIVSLQLVLGNVSYVANAAADIHEPFTQIEMTTLLRVNSKLIWQNSSKLY